MLSEQRPDSLALLLEQEQGRVPGLLGVRHSRMAVSPFTYFRGAAVVMASDLAREEHSGLIVQLCGDAHLLNFGFFASPPGLAARSRRAMRRQDRRGRCAGKIWQRPPGSVAGRCCAVRRGITYSER